MPKTNDNNFDFDDEPLVMAYDPLFNQLKRIEDKARRRAAAIERLHLELLLIRGNEIDIKWIENSAAQFPDLKPDILYAAIALRGEAILERTAVIEPANYKHFIDGLELDVCQGKKIDSIPETYHDQLFIQAAKLSEDHKREEVLTLFKDNYYSEYSLNSICTERAMAMLYIGKYNMASDCMKIRQLMHSRDVDIVGWTANLYWLSGHIDSALKLCERLKKRTKNKFEAYLTMADIYLSAGNYTEALDAYNMALNRRDNLSLLRCSKGMALKAIGDNRYANTCFKSALSLNPHLPQYCIETAMHWINMNRTHETRLFLDRAQAVLSAGSGRLNTAGATKRDQIQTSE